MKRIFALSIVLLASVIAWASEPRANGLFSDGCRAYESGLYDSAAACFALCLDEGYTSADVYYNLGNAYYRLGRLAPCILNYERSLMLNPRHADARQNLRLAYSKTTDNIETMPELFIVEWYYGLMQWLGVRGWRILAIALCVCLSAATAGFFIANSYALRKTLFLLGLAFTLLFALSLWMSIASSRGDATHHGAIVMTPMSTVKSAPDRSGVDRFILHEGTKVYIQDNIGDWCKVRLADGNTGWMLQQEVEPIF